MSNKIYETNYLDFYDPDKCLGDLGEKWCNFEWRIYDLHLNPQETLQSPIFTTRLLQNTHWYLEVELSYPGNLKSMKIALCRLQNGETSVSTVDVIYRVIFDVNSTISDKITLVYNNEKPRNEGYYRAPFYKSKNGFVTVECKLRPNKIMIQDVRHGDLDETLPVHLRKLLQSGELCDTIIKVGDQELMAHLSIICTRLPELLSTPPVKMKGKHIIKINNLPVSVVKEMLKYAYTGQAYLDSSSVSYYRKILLQYNNFFQRCCWEDNPSATTSFNYETDSVLWNLNDVCTKSNLGINQIELLRLYLNKLEFSLDILEPKDKKYLTLSFEFCGEEMPKPAIVSCRSSFMKKYSNDSLELGETETLLHSNITQGKVKLASLFKLLEEKASLFKKGNFFLKTDFRFCYGSRKSSIENLYKGQFDISQCTSCAFLRADMKHLLSPGGHWDICFKSRDGRRIYAHKAILISRWVESEKFNVKESSEIVMEDYDYEDLGKFLLQLYTGNSSV